MWYRVVWFESIGGEPSDHTAEILTSPTKGFNYLVIKASGGTFAEEKSNRVADILHSYLHGEICKWINDRGPISSIEEKTMRVLSNNENL